MAEVNMVSAITMALARALQDDERVVVFGEDVAKNGGVFRATDGLLERFSATDPPLVEITPGLVTVTAERRGMSLAALLDALDAQRAAVLGYLDTLGTDDLGRKARIPVFAPILGTDEVTLPVFVGAMFGMHWDAHADQIGQIRQAVGLSEAEYSSPAR